MRSTCYRRVRAAASDRRRRIVRAVAPSTAPPLARYLLAAYAFLIAYASLYPLASWRDQGADLFAYLFASPPRHITGFDVFANLLAYFPLGFLVATVVRTRRGPAAAIVIGATASLAISVTVEALQNYIPSRHPSNLDVVTNMIGGLVGAAAGASVALARILAARERWFRPGAPTDLGLVIIALWLVTQLNPETLLFGNGSLRDAFNAIPGQHHGPELFVRVEAAVAAAQLAAIGLFGGALVTRDGQPWVAALAIVVLALAVRTIAFAVMFTPANMLGWATPGALVGLAIGSAALAAASWMPRVARLAFAGLLLMGATALVNIAPANPYTAHTLQVWRQGHFLNFNGLTAFVSSAWPFAALAYLLFAGNRRAIQD